MTTSNNNQLRRRLLQGAVAAWTLSVSRMSFAAAVQIVAIRIWPAFAYTRITLESNTELQYRSFMLADPDRIVVDLTNVQLNSVLQHMGKIQPDDPFLKQVRVGQFDKNTVRLVCELKQRIRSDLFALKPIAGFKDRLVMDLYPRKHNVRETDDPLLALLEDYDKGDVDRRLSAKASAKPGKAGKDRPVVIVLDPGHGGEDPGAIGKNKTREKDVVLQIAQRLRELLRREPGMRVWMTRNEDIFIPLKVRVAEARRRQADLFISIHADAFTNRAAKGSSVFALSVRGATSNLARFLAHTQNEADDIGGVSRSGDKYLDSTMFDLLQTATVSDSLKFGQEVLGQMKKINSLHKHHVEQAGFAVLRAPDIPSILVETAFISNPEEEYKLRTRHFQQQIAASLLAGIKAHFGHGRGK